MQLLAERRLDGVVLLATALLVVAILLTPAPYSLVVLAAAAGFGIFVAWAVLGDLLVAVLFWFVTVIALHEELWRVRVPFFFALTVDRIAIVVVFLLWVAMWLLGRSRLRPAGAVYPLMAMILGYFTLSAIASGFQTVAVATVHYRLIGGYWFAFVVFFLVLHAVRHETHFRRLLIFFMLVGLYLTFTGWCEHFKIWALVFPKFIADPTKGIHWGRVRGPFLVSPAMGVALLFCFFNNLVLIRKAQRPARMMLYPACLAMLPVIFWTHTRSVWLGLILGTMVWLIYTRRRWSRTAAVCLLAVAAILTFFVNEEGFLSARRSRGGVMDTDPITMRIGLALISRDIWLDHPLVGAGFGHFRDVAPRYARDIQSPYYRFASQAMEHNNFLSILAETGLIGLLLFLALLVVLLRVSLRLYRRLPACAEGLIDRDIVVLFWVLFVIFVIDGMFRETSVYPFTNALFFGFAGLIVALDYLLRPQPIRPQAPAMAGRPAARLGRMRPIGAETAP